MPKQFLLSQQEKNLPILLPPDPKGFDYSNMSAVIFLIPAVRVKMYRLGRKRKLDFPLFKLFFYFKIDLLVNIPEGIVIVCKHK